MKVTNRALKIQAGCVTTDLANPKALLVKEGHIFDPTASTVSEIVADEITNVGYARVSVFWNPIVIVGGTAQSNLADIAFGNVLAGDAVQGAWIFEDLGDDATSVPVMFIEQPDGTAIVPDGSPLTIVTPKPTVIQRQAGG